MGKDLSSSLLKSIIGKKEVIGKMKINSEIHELLKRADTFILSEFHIKFHTEKKRIHLYNDSEWADYKNSNYDSNRHPPASIYDNETDQIHVCFERKYYKSNIFHEIYGHRFFFTRSDYGKLYLKIMTKIKSGLLSDSEAVKKYPKILNYGFQFKYIKNSCNGEGFAVWMEGLLCNEFKLDFLFTDKLIEYTKIRINNKYPYTYFDVYNKFIEEEKILTRLGIMKKLGFKL